MDCECGIGRSREDYEWLFENWLSTMPALARRSVLANATAICCDWTASHGQSRPALIEDAASQFSIPNCSLIFRVFVERNNYDIES